MSKKKGKPKTRAEPNKTAFCSIDNWDVILNHGYVSLADSPEVSSAVNKIADLISGMTIHLMENTDNGDIRVYDELAKKIDIYPNDWMTRKTFISVIVRNLLLEGDGNSFVYPETEKGFLKNLYPIPPYSVSMVPDGFGYKVIYNGKSYDPSEFIHVVINPKGTYPWKGTGYRVALKTIVENISQGNATINGFMKSKWKPSIIVKVDANTEEFASKEGRKKLLSKYIESSEAGEPWLIPAEQFEVETVKPLSLQDLAITDAMKLDKTTVASILDIPPFVLGVGEFKENVWNNFISTRIKNICIAIEQAFTKAILISPKRYFRFNCRSLYSYDIEKLEKVGSDLYTKGLAKGNEVRDWIELPPLDGLDKLVILENYIPSEKIGDQNKLKGGDSDGTKSDEDERHEDTRR